MSKTNVYLKQVICPKPKLGLFNIWFFSVGLCVCGCVRATSRKLRELETRNFAEMFIYTYCGNAFFCFSKFIFCTPQSTVYLSHCLFRAKVYSNLLITQNYVYLKPGIRPKQKIGLISYNTQLTVYLPPCLPTPNVYSNLLICKKMLSNKAR